jgi:serine/threonine-protein kinase
MSALPPAPLPDQASAGSRNLVGQLLGRKYRVTALLGEGGMGSVFEAEHAAIGRKVAIKVLHPKHANSPEAASRLEHEARVVGGLGHPNICGVLDLGELEDGSPYLVMDRLQGETLAQRLARLGRIPFREVLGVAIQVLSALVVAHGKSVMHRDLKPENVFLSQRASMPVVVKLLDFGISKAMGPEEPALSLTRTGMVMGTPYYMAPEQARGDRTLDHRVDLWALGVILYEALGGRRPFVARNYNALLMQILTSRHRSLSEIAPDVPAELVAVVDRALSKMREDRYQTAAELQAVLVEIHRRFQPAAPSAMAVIPGAIPDLTQIYETTTDDTPLFISGRAPQAAPAGEDVEETIVDPPSFADDCVTVTFVRGKVPGRG